MTPDQLQQRLEQFGAGLTAPQLEEFRKILWEIGVLHNSIGDIYKYAELSLIPRDRPIATTVTTPSTFIPEKKKTGNPLEELLHNVQKLSPSQVESIRQNLSQPSQDETS